MKDKEWEVENVATRYCDFLGIIKVMANSHAATSGDSGNVYFPTNWASIAFTIETWQSHHIWRCWIFWIWKTGGYAQVLHQTVSVWTLQIVTIKKQIRDACRTSRNPAPWSKALQQGSGAWPQTTNENLRRWILSPCISLVSSALTDLGHFLLKKQITKQWKQCKQNIIYIL